MPKRRNKTPAEPEPAEQRQRAEERVLDFEINDVNYKSELSDQWVADHRSDERSDAVRFTRPVTRGIATGNSGARGAAEARAAAGGLPRAGVG